MRSSFLSAVACPFRSPARAGITLALGILPVPFQEEFLVDLVLGTACGLLLMGYFVQTVRHSAEGREGLPKWAPREALLDGLRLLVATLPFLLGVILVNIPHYLAARSSPSMPPAGNAVLVAVVLVLSLWPAAVGRLARLGTAEGRNVAGMWADVRRNPVGDVLVLAVLFGASLLPLAVGPIPSAAAETYSLLVAAHLLGRFRIEPGRAG